MGRGYRVTAGGRGWISPVLSTPAAPPSGGGGGPPPPPPPPPSGNAPARLSGLQIVQAGPLHPSMPLGQAIYFATLVPQDGIGPFSFRMTAGDAAKYRVATPYFLNLIGLAGSTADSITVECTDARGDKASGTLAVAKQSDLSVPTLLLFPRGDAGGQPGFTGGPLDNNGTRPDLLSTFFRMTAGGSFTSLTGVTYAVYDQGTTTPSTAGWGDQYGYIWHRVGGVAAPGVYPVTIVASDGQGNAASLDYNIVINQFVVPSYIEFSQGIVSTSILAASVVGKAAATTPRNVPKWTLTDTSNTLQIDASTGIVTIKNPPGAAGTYPFTISVQDGVFALYTQSFNLAVVAGNTLSSGNMAMTVNPALNNATRGQSIGTPTVTGVTGTKSWRIVSQTGFNLETKLAIAALGRSYAERYIIDPSTGSITAPPLLSFQTDTIAVSCTDGINTCTRSFSVPVAEAPYTHYWVGRGMSTAHGTSGMETFAEARAKCIGYHTDTKVFHVQADADPDYYTNDNGKRTGDYSLRFAWIGPVRVIGEAANGVTQPRFGGPASNTQIGGNDMNGKGFIVFGDGDGWIENCEVSCCHGGSTTGVEGIRKDGETYGNLSVRNCVVRDCDNGIETGVTHGTMLVEYTELGNCGTAHVSSGACHNAYIGAVGQLIFRFNVSRRATLGHLLKTRAANNDIHDNRFFDGLSGSASVPIELPFGGQATIQNNVIVKGAMAMNPYAIQYGAEGTYYLNNVLAVSNNTIALETLDGSHYGTPAAFAYFHVTNVQGVGSSASYSNNSIYYSPNAKTLNMFNNAPIGAATVSGTVTLTLPPTLDVSRPFLTGNLPALGTLYRHTLWSQDDFRNFSGVQQIQDRDQIVTAHTTAAGTVLCNLAAHNDLSAGIENFGPGTTWAVITDGVYYPVQNPNPWAPNGRYSVTSNADGTGALKVAASLSTGVDWVQLRATGSNGTTFSDSRYPVVIT